MADIKLAGGALSAQDQEREDAVDRERDRAERTRVDLDRITDRSSSTRELNVEQVAALADSIAAVDLIQPIAVDRQLRLLAGGHRRAALQLLRTTNPEAFAKWFADGVPVRRYAFDADKDPNLALGVEVAENELRRDYTRDEVEALINRLSKAGYKDTAGRPKAGELALTPALQVVLGKSLRTVRRLLAEKRGVVPPEPGPDHAIKALRRALDTFLENTSGSRREEVVDLRTRARALRDRVEKTLD